MSRILFAAARGARIQEYVPIRKSTWADTVVVYLPGIDAGEYRIHPADAHLQYGPISSQYRKMAEGVPQDVGDIDCEFGYFELPMSDWYNLARADELTRSLFLLFLAEALADEGM